MTEKRKNLTDKEKLTLKIGMSIIIGIAAVHIALWLILSFFMGKSYYYMNHFLVPIILLCIGLFAIIFPYYNKYSSYQANTKGDNFMPIIGVCLIFCAFITLILSYSNF